MSQRHPGSRRTQQQSRQEPDDVFIAKVLHFGKWAEANQQLLTVLAVVLAIVFAGMVYYRNYRQSLLAQASQQLEIVYQTASIQDFQGARDELVTFLERFSGTPHEGEARLLLGDLYLRDGSPEQALAVLGPMGDSPREPLEFQAAALLAAAYEEDRRWDEAEETYLAIAQRSELGFQVRDALAAAARIRASQGDPSGAIELYQRALDQLEEGEIGRAAFEMRIAELEAFASS